MIRVVLAAVLLVGCSGAPTSPLVESLREVPDAAVAEMPDAGMDAGQDSVTVSVMDASHPFPDGALDASAYTGWSCGIFSMDGSANAQCKCVRSPTGTSAEGTCSDSFVAQGGCCVNMWPSTHSAFGECDCYQGPTADPLCVDTSTAVDAAFNAGTNVCPPP